MRLLSAEATIALQDLRKGTIKDEQWSKIAATVGRHERRPAVHRRLPEHVLMEIRAKCRRLKQKHDLKLVILDYLQLMSSGKKVESRQQEVSEFSRALKLLAKELQVPVIALSQLNRGSEQRTDKKPQVSDLRESGSIEQDADMVILLHREDVYDKESPRAGEADLIVPSTVTDPRRTSWWPSRATTRGSPTWPPTPAGSEAPPRSPVLRRGRGTAPGAPPVGILRDLWTTGGRSPANTRVDAMGMNTGGHPWTPRDQMLLRTAQVIHAYLHGEFDQIRPMPVDFAVAGSYPDHRIIAAAPYSRYAFKARGDGTSVHDGGFFFATGGLGLAMTAGVAIGRAVGNARRRARTEHLSTSAWHPLDRGSIYVNQFGFYLRTPTSLDGWGWGDILECQMLEPGRLALLGVSAAGQRNYIVDSHLAELLFASWAIARQPQHWQFLQRVWLLPEWVERYRSVYGADAYDFTQAFPGHFGQIT